MNFNAILKKKKVEHSIDSYNLFIFFVNIQSIRCTQCTSYETVLEFYTCLKIVQIYCWTSTKDTLKKYIHNQWRGWICKEPNFLHPLIFDIVINFLFLSSKLWLSAVLEEIQLPQTNINFLMIKQHFVQRLIRSHYSMRRFLWMRLHLFGCFVLDLNVSVILSRSIEKVHWFDLDGEEMRPRHMQFRQHMNLLQNAQSTLYSFQISENRKIFATEISPPIHICS